MAVQYLTKGVKIYMGNATYPDSNVQNVGRIWSAQFSLSHDTFIHVNIDNIWGVDEGNKVSVLLNPTIDVSLDNVHWFSIATNGQLSERSWGPVPAGQHVLKIELMPYKQEVDDFIFEGLSIASEVEATITPLGQSFTAVEQRVAQSVAQNASYQQPQQVMPQPDRGIPALQFAGVLDEKPPSRFWGKLLGILNILMALLLGISIIMIASVASGNLDTFLLGILCVFVFMVIMGFVLGIRSISGKRRSKLWSFLYLIITPIIYFLLSFSYR